MCRKDVAFFLVTFGALFEPRPVPRWLPFHLWKDQVTLLAYFTEIYGRRHGLVNKTRGIGVSWLFCGFLFHKWLFENDAMIAVLSEDAERLDGADPNSVIGKLQYLFDHLPEWAKYTRGGNLKLKRLTEKHTFVNVETRAVVAGYVSTGTKLRGLRFTCIVADEFAFYKPHDQKEWWASASGCSHNVLLVSTWGGFDDTFHYFAHEASTTMLRMEAWWWNNEERYAGAYRMDAGTPTILDKSYKFPADYEFGEPDILDEGTIRSPWIDSELSAPSVDRLKTLRDLYGASVCEQTNTFFDSTVRAAIKESVTPPTKQGMLDTSDGSVRVLPTNRSNIRLWGGVPDKNRGPYVMGCDLARGVGGAFSVACVLDAGGDQVLEYGDNSTNETQFAYNCVLIARWLAQDEGDGWVLIDAEANGQQIKPFGAELVRLDYGNIHYSEHKAQKVTALGEVPKYIGTVNRDGGLANFNELSRAILSMDARLRSEHIANDMRLCSKDDVGKPRFPTHRSDGHGDFCHAAGIAWWRARSTASTEERERLDSDMIQWNYTEKLIEPANHLWSAAWAND